jgi:hypothetical protein
VFDLRVELRARIELIQDNRGSTVTIWLDRNDCVAKVDRKLFPCRFVALDIALVLVELL